MWDVRRAPIPSPVLSLFLPLDCIPQLTQEDWSTHQARILLL